MKRWLIVLAVSLGLLAPAAAFWQSRDSNYNIAISSGASFHGIGDLTLTAGQPFIGGSCARVYKASQANTSTSLCDLVAVTGGAAVCTLRASSTGYVDLSAYCPGSLTPAAACAAASGGSCKVTKVYDLVAGTNPLIQATLGNMPILVFSTLNSLPALFCASATASSLTTASTFTISAPFSLAVVYERTASFTSLSAAWGAVSNNMAFGNAASANTAIIQDSSTANFTAAMSDGTGPSDFTHFHALLGVYGSGVGNSALTIDGTTTTGSTNNSITTAIRICRGNATASPDGYLMEAYFWPTNGGLTSGDRTSVNSNMHGSSGYNF